VIGADAAWRARRRARRRRDWLLQGAVALLLVALAVLLMIFLIGQFEGHVLHPLVMSRAANLHPVAVALSVVSGAILGGIVGAMVAVPIVSTSWAVRKYLRDTRLVVD